MSEHVLAVIGKVIEIKAIEGADRIKSATVVCGKAGKWIGIVGLDVAIGQLVTVFLQDAVLPEDPRWAFMEKSKWRVKMARFKGSPSECLIMALGDDEPIGTDLTGKYGVIKHYKPIPESMTGVARGTFPTFIPKTDEENFQRVPELVARMNEGYTVTLKMDGTSMTAWNAEYGLHVASRNMELLEFTESGQGNAYWRAARKYGLERLPASVAIQMEVCGPGIQSNPAGFEEVCAFAFKAFNFDLRRYLYRTEFDELCDSLDIPKAAVIERDDTPAQSDDVLRDMADLKYPNGKPAEGIVIASNMGDWSFKVINLAYGK